MSPDPAAEWDALGPEIDALLELGPADRSDRLAVIARDDPARAAALADWLAAIDASEGRLERAAPAPPTGLGPWRALAPVGRGGMGEVWRGERADGAFARTVAIKLLRGDRRHVASAIARERASLARLRHPAIAQLLDGGVADDGRPWLAVEWIDGEPLDQWLARADPPLRERVRLIERIARAVAHAHAQLVVHRDLKPANVLVTADGEPRLLDFGIARLTDAGEAAGETLAQALTPAWAAPEQLRGGVADARTDVHGLGGLLHLAITGRPPVADETPSLARIVAAVCEAEPVAPGIVAPAAGIDADLDAITLAARARDPERRYASADAFANDLARWLAGEAVSARLPTRAERLTRFVRRHRVESLLAGGLAIALVGGLVATAWQARQAEAARRVAVAERDAALAEADRGESLVDAFARLFREAPDDARLGASDWLDRAAALADAAGPDHPAAAATLLAKLAAIEQDRGQPARALALLERVVALPGSALAAAERARAECRLGSARHRAGDAAGARAAWAAGTARAEGLAGAERLALVDCLLSSAGRALTDGETTPADFDAARRALAELDRLSVDADLRWRRAGALYVLAGLHDLAGDDAEAARRYGEVLALDRALGNTASADHAALVTAMAGALDRAGDWDAALARYDEGIAILEALGGLSPNLASDLANRAGLRQRRGDAAGALDDAERALAVLDALGDGTPAPRFNASLAQGRALVALGRLDEAAATLAAPGLDRIADRSGVARRGRLDLARAELALARGDLEAAARLVAPTVEAARAEGAEGLLAESLSLRARLAIARGDAAAANADAREAAALHAARLSDDHSLRRAAGRLADDGSATVARPAPVTSSDR
jgi:tetratricopeptide (TPR) repeat protein